MIQRRSLRSRRQRLFFSHSTTSVKELCGRHLAETSCSRLSDVETVCRFYRSLGLAFSEERHGSGPVHFSAPLGDAILEIYPLPSGQAVDASTRLGFTVCDPDAVVSNVDSLGGRIIKAGRETAWGYMAIVGDPDGRTIELYRA